jgi:hypothetical protein
MTGTNCDLFTHNQSRSYLKHLVEVESVYVCQNATQVRHVQTTRTNLQIHKHWPFLGL